MILINSKISENEKLAFVKKYYRSFEKGQNVVLDDVLLTSASNKIYIGEHNNATIITHAEIPYLINYDARNIGIHERQHPLCSKLTKTFPNSEIFCFYFNDVSNYFGYTVFSNGLRIRYKNNFVSDYFSKVKEAGNLLDSEKNYYAFSKIIHIEPGDKVIIDLENNIFAHYNLLSQREYYLNTNTNKELKKLNEYQCAFNVIMDTSKVFLGQTLEKLPLEKIIMAEYGS